MFAWQRKFQWTPGATEATTQNILVLMTTIECRTFHCNTRHCNLWKHFVPRAVLTFALEVINFPSWALHGADLVLECSFYSCRTAIRKDPPVASASLFSLSRSLSWLPSKYCDLLREIEGVFSLGSWLIDSPATVRGTKMTAQQLRAEASDWSTH